MQHRSHHTHTEIGKQKQAGSQAGRHIIIKVAERGSGRCLGATMPRDADSAEAHCRAPQHALARRQARQKDRTTFCRAHRHVSRGEWQGLEGEWLWRVEKSLFVWWRIEGQGILSSIDSNCARRSVCPGSAQRARQQQARVSHGGRPQAGPRTGKTDRRRGGCGG